MFIDSDRSRLQNCPAEVDMDTGDIYINRDVWDRYTEAEKRFILQHEIGHYRRQTDSETEADLYALNANFGKIDLSLRSSFTAIEKAGVADENRWNTLYLNALRIDAEHGNEEAAEELKRIQQNQQSKNSDIMTKNYRKSQITYIQPMVAMNRVNSFDGQDQEPVLDNPPVYIDREGQGIYVGRNFFSYETIVLAVIAIILFFKLK